jgi:predicted regulator of Ras-like GTPase activity (Roadblock/LC7/MglB family)
MSIDVKSLSVLIDSIVELGAKICVLSDKSGLPMVTRSNLDQEDVEIALSALSSLVIPTGDTIARELEGNFVNMTVRTTGGLLLSTVIDSNPQVVLTAIVDENLETTITHEMRRLQPIISNAMEGIAVEIKERERFEIPNQRQISIFFDSLQAKIKQAVNPQDLVSIMRGAKDDLYTLVNSGTISYEMNRYVLKLQKDVQNRSPNPEFMGKIKKDITDSIADWKIRLNAS